MALCYPKTKSINEIQRVSSGQTYKILDKIVILVNVALLIIARFDWKRCSYLKLPIDVSKEQVQYTWS